MKVSGILKGGRGTSEPEARRKSFGLVGWLEETRIQLPLRGVECRFDVCGDLAAVAIEQVFHQANTKPMHCTYTFPLPANAAVYRCEMRVGQRVIVAKVEEEETARKRYAEKVAEGRRAGLVEVERDNLFTLSLGNVQPGDVIVVRLEYFQTVERLGHDLSLLIPFCPGIRYIPGQPLWRESRGPGVAFDTDEVPDASRITPPRMGADHEDAAYVNIEGHIDLPGLEPAQLVSPLHKINVRPAVSGVDVGIDLNDAIPDRDFVLRWKELEPPEAVGSAWLHSEAGETYALVQLKAPVQVATREGFQQDIYFLVDRSGSMAGEKWSKTAAALKAFVGKLGDQDRVWITFFETHYADFAEAPLAAGVILRDRRFSSIEDRGTGGGTEIVPALRHALEVIQRFSMGQGRRAALVIITDGEVGNENAVLQTLQGSGALTVHAFGVDTTVNDALLRRIARQHGGRCVLQTPKDDIQSAVTALAVRLRRPVVTDIQMLNGWELPGDQLPDLHAGDVLTVALRHQRSGERLEFVGRRADGAEHRFAFSPTNTTSPALKRLWVRDRIDSLLSNQQNADAVRLAVANNILCPGTAFVAWDDHEQVVVADQTCYQPSLLPHAWQGLAAPPAAAWVRFKSPPTSIVQGFADRGFTRMKGRAQIPLADYPVTPKMASPTPALAIRWLDTPGGHQFRDALENWAGTDRKRKRALRKLDTDLLRHAGDIERGRRLCAEFVLERVGESLDPVLRDRLRHALDDQLRKHVSWPDICRFLSREVTDGLCRQLLESLAQV